MQADVIVGLQHGDEGKGKVTHHLCANGGYTHVIRYNGGCNAGHTIYHNKRKFVTHHIPAGIFYGIKSIIGPGCVVYPEQFFKEINELNEAGINTEGLIYIADNTHIITNEHVQEDRNDNKIGTTKMGNGPAYRDKYNRSGKRAKSFCSYNDNKFQQLLRPFLINLYEELYVDCKHPKILFEGAQGFGLDIDWGDYPYVTSSHCTAAGALLNGVPPKSIRKVWGIAKIYETYVGAKKFHGEDQIFDDIQRVGEEFGATTGRPRQCYWLNWEQLNKAININGVTDLVINKFDILDKLQRWAITDNGIIRYFDTSLDMQSWLLKKIDSSINVYFSRSKNTI
jgi:adenylosuccinate synthase